MLGFGKTNVIKGTILWCNKSIKIWNVDVDNIIISKLIETRHNSKCLIEYLDDVITPLVFILPKMC